MAPSVQFRPQSRDLGMVMREVDENLAIFLGMRNGEKERHDHVLVQDSNDFDDSTSAEPKPDTILIQKSLQPETVQIVDDNDLLNLEIERSDYDWLLTQSDTSLLTSEDVDKQDSAANQADISNSEAVSLKSEVANTSDESASSLTSSGLQLATSMILDSSAAASRKPLPSGDRKPSSRAATPNGRPSLPAKSKPSRASTPTSRATSASKSASASSKPTAAQARSSTPSRATSRSSTPNSRPMTQSSSKSASRSATATRKPSTPSTISSISASDASSSGRKTVSKNPVPTRVSSQTVKTRPSKTSEMLSLSHDAIQNPKTIMPKRPASASRGRPSAPAATHSSSSNVKPRQKSCSPAKIRAANVTAHKIGNVMLSRSRGHSYGGGGDDVNPVLMGTKMVERVVNMRKLAPPKQDDQHISLDNPKKSSLEKSGFGRSLSNRSLDMAIRHMEIRRSIPDNLSPVATSVSSSFVSGNQSGSSQSSTVGFSESPLTSTSDSSKSSNCVNSYFLDGRRIDD